MDFKTVRFHTLPGFYRGLFTVWRLLQKQRGQHDSLFWLLQELRPLLGGSSSHRGLSAEQGF